MMRPTRIDAQGAILAPGFVDLHIHGSFGKDVLAPGGTAHLVKHLPSVGTTSFCPTNATDSFETIHRFLGEVKQEMAHNHQGTRILGAHIEGPFFNVDNRGAHAIPMLQDPTLENYRKMAGEYEDVIVRVSLAPEKKGARNRSAIWLKRGLSFRLPTPMLMQLKWKKVIAKALPWSRILLTACMLSITEKKVLSA